MTIQSSNVSFGDSPSGSESGPVIPLRILAVADLSREGRAVGEQAPAETVRVDKESFDSLFARLRPRLLIEVPNTFEPKSDDIVLDLEFNSIADFEGPALARKVPSMNALEQLRATVVKQAGDEVTAEELRRIVSDVTAGAPFASELSAAIAGAAGPSAKPGRAAEASPPEARPTPASEGEASVDSIVSMVGGGEEQPGRGEQEAKRALGSVISSITGSSRKAHSAATQGALAAMHGWIDAQIGRQLDAVLHHPDFQSMESAWRGLRFLVERIDFRKDIVLEVLAARKADLRRCLLSEVLEDELNAPSDPPLAVIVCAEQFDSANPDIELLNEIAVKCELLQAPFIADVSAAFFARDSLHALGLFGSLNELLAGPRFTKWKALRAKEEMRWAALTVNRMLLRRPAEGGDGAFPESPDESTGRGLLWGSPAWALGACIAASFAREGWAHSISGPRNGGGVDNLPLRAFQGRPSKTLRTPLETQLSEANVQDLAAAGLIPLSGRANSDSASFTFLPSIAAAKRYSNPAATQEAGLHATLPFQLYAGRMALYLGRILAQSAGAGSAEELQERVAAAITGLLGQPAAGSDLPQVRVEVSDHDDDPSRYQICIETRPAFKLFGLSPRLALTVTRPK